MLALSLALCLTAAPNPLVGRWDNGAGFVLVLAGDGTGTLADSAASPPEAIRWKASANRLAISQDGETVTYALGLDHDVLSLSGGDLDQPVRLRRAGATQATTAAPPPTAPRQLPPTASATCPQACQYFLTCAAQLGAVSTANPQVQLQCLRECQGSGMTPYQLAVFVNLSCQQAVAFVVAAEQAAQGQQQQRAQRKGGACQGCVRWGNDCMWSSQSDWGPGHYGNNYSGAVSSCDPSCCGL